MDRAADLRADYERLGAILAVMGAAEGSAAAAVARERRLIAVELERLEQPGEPSRVDELAAKRANAGVVRPASRRRKSG